MKKLETTKNIALDSILRIYKKGYGYSMLQVIDSHDYFLAAMADREFVEAVKEGDIVEIYLWVEDIASYVFKLEVIGWIRGEQNIVFFNHTEDIVRSNDRRCLGAETKLPIKFFLFNPSDLHKSFSTEAVVFLNGTIIWLEDREAIIKTEESMQEDTFLRGHINIENEDTEVVGKLESLNEEKHIYNIRFTGLQDEDRNRILDYIFKTYRE